MKKELASVIVIRKTPEEMAGSSFSLFSNSGMAAPKRPAVVMVMNIDTANTKLKYRLCCQK